MTDQDRHVVPRAPVAPMAKKHIRYPAVVLEHVPDDHGTRLYRLSQNMLSRFILRPFPPVLLRHLRVAVAGVFRHLVWAASECVATATVAASECFATVAAAAKLNDIQATEHVHFNKETPKFTG